MSKRKKNPSRDRSSSRLQQTINGLVLASALAVSLSAIAEGKTDTTAKRHYHISSGSLSHALTQFAGSAGILLSTDARLTDGKSSKGLDGEYTVEEGFQRLLAGSGLMYKITDKNTVTLQVVDNQSQSNPTSLPAVKVVASKDELNDPYNKVYTVRNSSTATKTDTPIFDTPVSLQVVPRAVMDDQNTPRIKDALENVSGVRPLTTMGMGTGYIMRGFATNRVYRNGLVAAPNAWPSEFDTANLESVEVLKGPTAVLFGRAEPGGLINLTTKKPLDTPYYSLQQQFGSYDYYRTQWDATGPINKDKTLLCRFNGSYQNNNSFRDLVSNDRVMISPSLTWKPNDKTDFSLGADLIKCH
ncbi:MAG: TonB-dependent receptor plug domain-containing protein [Methylococcales bacterium]